MGTGSGIKRAGLFLICLLLLLQPSPAAAAENEPKAENLTRRCSFSFTGSTHGLERMLTDGITSAACRMLEGDVLTVRSEQDMSTLLLRLSQLSSTFLLVEGGKNGLIHRMRIVRTDVVALTVPLKAGCRWVQLLPLEEKLYICEASAFGPGAMPDDIPHPEAPLEKTDFLLIATHPDDEWVFLGGVYPIYGGERGYAGTVAYVTLPSWERGHECINGLWIGGVRTHPFFLGFPDIYQSAPKKQKDLFKREEVVLALVRLYRRIKPLVVVTQDPENGEYGHWQHKLSASAAFDAVKLAADPTYDPASEARYGVWTVRKMYQHFARGMSTLELDVDAPLSHYGGRSALEVAQAGYKAHKSQRRTPYRPGAARASRGDIRQFGLTWSTVGPDTGEDLFEHIPEAELAANWQATEPPATMAPEPTAEPTFEPAPTPNSPAAPTVNPTRAPAPTAAPSFWDGVEEKAGWMADHASLLSAVVVLLAAAAVALKQYRRAHHRRRKSE